MINKEKNILQKGKVEPIKQDQLEDLLPGDQISIWPQSYDFNENIHFGGPRTFMDTSRNLVNALSLKDTGLLSKDEEGRGKYNINIKGAEVVSVRFRLGENNAQNDDFYSMILDLGSPGLILTLCAYLAHCNKRKSWDLTYVKLTDILKTAGIEPHVKKKYYSLDQKRTYTKYTHILSDISIYLDYKDKKGKTNTLQVPFISLKEFQPYQKKVNGEFIPDHSIIEIFKKGSEVLPDINKNVAPRLIPWTIFELDPNPRKDGPAVLLGYDLSIRFSQRNQQKEDLKPVKILRGDLIKRLGLQGTNKTNPKKASQRAEKHCQKLIENSIIKGFSPKKIPTNNDAWIYFSPLEDFKGLNQKKGYSQLSVKV